MDIQWAKSVKIKRKGELPSSMHELKQLLREYWYAKGIQSGSLQYEAQLAYIRHKHTNYTSLLRRLRRNQDTEKFIIKERCNQLAEEILGEIKVKNR